MPNETDTSKSCKPPSSKSPSTPCCVLEILWSCGLHPKYHPDLKTAAEGVRETIRQLRRDLSDPTHDIQCQVLEKLGVDGFAKPENTTHRLVMFNPNSPHNDKIHPR